MRTHTHMRAHAHTHTHTHTHKTSDQLVAEAAAYTNKRRTFVTAAAFEPTIPAVRFLQPYTLRLHSHRYRLPVLLPIHTVFSPRTICLLFDKTCLSTRTACTCHPVPPPPLPLHLYHLCRDDGGSSLGRNVGVHLPSLTASITRDGDLGGVPSHTFLVAVTNIGTYNFATSRKVAGSITNGVIGIFHLHNPSGRTAALGSTQPLTEMSTGSISWG